MRISYYSILLEMKKNNKEISKLINKLKWSEKN